MKDGNRSAAIAGVGYTAFSRESGRSVLSLATEAARACADDAGLPLTEVDGVGSFMVLNDSVSTEAVATTLAVPELRWTMDFQQGGQSPCFVVGMAALAIEAGLADSVIVFRALNGRSSIRVGSGQFAGPGGQYRYPIGYSSYLMYIAMWAQRYLYETGCGEEDLAKVAVAQRRYSELNCRAINRRPLDFEAYFGEKYVAEPFRPSDCTREVDGGCAVLVTSLDRARDLRHPPAVVRSAAYRAGARPGLDIGDQISCDDYSRNFTSLLASELYERAGLGPGDIEFAEIYDCFTSVVLMGLEGLGLCARGEAGGFVGSGATWLDGQLPTNTHGGLLGEGYLHGMNTVAEAVLQIQGRGGDRQVPHHDATVVTSGALIDGSAMILTSDT
jgi:acetyl-CoA acetyltransferase